MNKISIVLLALIIVANFASAIQVEDLQTGIVENSEELVAFRAEITAKMLNLEAKIGELPTKQETTDLLVAHLQKTNEIMDNFRSMLIVSFIISGFCIIGLFLSAILLLKSKGRF